ncbi:hypothetical protein L484_011823 [Morus notabilis]|uniref:Uncharacterized protein n=1 Tax=Morus notabilis TaxID=981085 RepID=W9S6B7_9ROSA|nr:hypothetical protein L484_011823 [Morus notabilis]
MHYKSWEDNQEEDVAPDPAHASSSRPPHRAPLTTLNIEERVARLEQAEQTRIQEIQQLRQEFHHYASWQVEATAALVQMLGQYTGAPDPWLPPAPVFPPYPPPATAEDEDDDSEGI